MRMHLDGFSTSDNDSISDMNFAYIHYLVMPSPDLNDVNIKTYKTPAAEYKILSYTNSGSLSPDEESQCDKYRSVVYSGDGDLVSFSPPRGLSFDKFRDKNPILNDEYVINECVEGTMMNLFYDSKIGSWELATKGAIGGNYHFYRTQYPHADADSNKTPQLSFRQMFMDVFRANDLNADLNSLAFLQYFSKEYSYTFVIQHPANHIVQQIEHPLAYLVAVYHICDNRAVYIPSSIYEEWNCFLDIRGMLEFPEKVGEFDVYVEYDFICNTFCEKNSHPSMGWMITHMKTGDRCHIENPKYTELRELRGNNPNLLFQFLHLNRINKVADFIFFFPQYRGIFCKFQEQYSAYVTNLHESYVSYYVKKENIRISKKYFANIYKMHHTIYLPSLALRETDGSRGKTIMRKSVVRDYVKNMDPKSLLYYLNYTDTDEC